MLYFSTFTFKKKTLKGWWDFHHISQLQTSHCKKKETCLGRHLKYPAYAYSAAAHLLERHKLWRGKKKDLMIWLSHPSVRLSTLNAYVTPAEMQLQPLVSPARGKLWTLKWNQVESTQIESSETAARMVRELLFSCFLIAIKKATRL